MTKRSGAVISGGIFRNLEPQKLLRKRAAYSPGKSQNQLFSTGRCKVLAILRDLTFVVIPEIWNTLKNRRILRGGDLVKVRSYEEILHTLDPKGTINGLPFMPEMTKFCGRTYRVHKRAHRVCIDEQGDGDIKDTVFLDNLRCDGTFHDGCKKCCTIMWKEAWLKRVDAKGVIFNENDAMTLHQTFDFPVKLDDRYFCQSTAIGNATFEIATFSRIPRLMLTYIREWRFKNQKTLHLTKSILKFIIWKLGITNINLNCKVIFGECNKTPSLSLDLKAGERVRVKSEEEIRNTLDRNGCNHGLRFSAEMFTFCGREFIVKERVNKMILENFGKMIELKQTVMLEDVTCVGQCRFGCGRNMYHFWREIWLERA